MERNGPFDDPTRDKLRVGVVFVGPNAKTGVHDTGNDVLRETG